MCNFSAGISMQEFSLGENLPGTLPRFCSRQDSRRVSGGEFFLDGISASTVFLARFLRRYGAGTFPWKDPAGKTGHLGEIQAGSRWVQEILAGSWWDPAIHFTREQPDDIFSFLNLKNFNDWLTDWLTYWLTDWLTDWPTDWLAHWVANRLIEWVIYWEFKESQNVVRKSNFNLILTLVSYIQVF